MIRLFTIFAIIVFTANHLQATPSCSIKGKSCNEKQIGSCNWACSQWKKCEIIIDGPGDATFDCTERNNS